MVELQPSKLVVRVRFPSPAFMLLGFRKIGSRIMRLTFPSLCLSVSSVAENLLVLESGLAGCAAVAQLVERVLGKDEAMGSSPISSFC